jgi:hypothetical protein
MTPLRDSADRVRSVTGAGYRSTVCSTPEQPLSRLARAIEDLAEDWRDGTADGELAERIAGVWGMIADLDPELARRWSDYEGPAQPGQPAPGR